MIIIIENCFKQAMELMPRQFSTVMAVIFYLLLLSISEAQLSSDQQPVSTSAQHARTIIAVLPVIGILVLCAMAGAFVYCICQSRSGRRADTVLVSNSFNNITET